MYLGPNIALSAHARTKGGGAPAWTPDLLFASGEAGGAWDYSDPTKLRQLSDGTGAVTSASDPVGWVEDLSGNGNHKTQTNTAKRCVYSIGPSRTVFDGATSALSTQAINFTSTDKLTIITCFRVTSAGSTKVISELSTNYNGNNGSFLVSAGTTNTLNAGLKGTAVGSRSTADNTAPFDKVLTAEYDISQAALAEEISIRINGVTPSLTLNLGPCGTGSFGNYPLFSGARNQTSLYHQGAKYREIVIGRALTSEERAYAEAWCGEPASLFF